MKKAPTSKRYSEAFKRQSVAEIESGKTTVVELRRKYGIGGDLTVIGWLKRYGTGKASGEKRWRARRARNKPQSSCA